MIQRVKKPIKFCWMLLAYTIIFFAVVLQFVKWSLPHINTIKPSLERYVSEQIGASVELGSISASWTGFRPRVSVSDLVLSDINRQEFLSIEYANMQLDILLSLYHWTPVWQRVEAKGVNLNVTQSENGAWNLGGMSTNTSDKSWSYRSPSALFLMARSVDLEESKVRLTLFNERQITTDIPFISIQNNGHFHRLSANAAIGSESEFTFVLEGVGNPSTPNQFFAEAYLKLNRFPVEKLVKFFSQAAVGNDQPSLEQEVNSEANSEIWFDFASPSRFLMSGNLEFLNNESSEFAKRYYLNIPFKTDIVGDYSIEKGLLVGLRDIQIDQTLALDEALLTVHNKKISTAVTSIDIEPWVQWAEQRLIRTASLSEFMDKLSPTGQITNLYSILDLVDLNDFMLKANINNIKTYSWRGIPEFKNISGYLESSNENGYLVLDTADFGFFPVRIYDSPISARRASGLIDWRINIKEKQANISGYDLKMEGAYGEANGIFSLDLGWRNKQDRRQLSLQLGLKNSQATYHQIFVPSVLPKSTLAWLERSIQGGNISEAGLFFRGDLRDKKDQSVQFFADIENGKLDFSEKWPALNNLLGHIFIDNNHIGGEVKQAEIYEGDRLSGYFDWNKNKKNVLEIEAQGTATTVSGLRYLRESWLQTILGDVVTDVTGKGSLAIDVNLDIPLNNSTEEPKQNINILFKDNQLDVNKINLSFKDIIGTLNYSSDSGLRSTNLSANLFNEPLKVKIGEDIPNAEILRINGSGNADVKSIEDWLAQPLLSYTKGMFDYQFDINIPLKKPEEKAKLTLFSNLVGVESSLPLPFKKVKSKSLPFQFEMPFTKGIFQYELSIGEILKSKVIQKGVDRSVSVSVSDIQYPTLKAMPSNGIVVNGEFSHLDVSALSSFIRELPATDSSSLHKVDISVLANSWSLNENQFEKINVSGQKEDQGWSFFVDSDYASGGLYFDDNKDNPIIIDMDKLAWTPRPIAAADLNDIKSNIEPIEGDSSDQVATFFDEFDPRSIPPLKITINNFIYGGKSLGDWKMNIQADDYGLTVSDLIATAGSFTLAGDKEFKGATLRWIAESDDIPESTKFTGIIFGDNPKDFFEQWDIPFILESKKTTLKADLFWLGSPMVFAVEKLEGKISTHHKEGVFTQDKTDEAAGALKLFGLLNFDSWARRVRLDFSDVYKSGMVFDDLKGAISLDKGNITISDPIVFKGPSSRLSLSGSVDYPNQTIDASLVANLPISGNLTFVTALVGGLPAAAGVYIVSKLFEKQVDKVTSINYAIRGDWSDPIVKVEKVGNEAIDQALDQEVEQVIETDYLSNES